MSLRYSTPVSSIDNASFIWFLKRTGFSEVIILLLLDVTVRLLLIFSGIQKCGNSVSLVEKLNLTGWTVLIPENDLSIFEINSCCLIKFHAGRFCRRCICRDT